MPRGLSQHVSKSRDPRCRVSLEVQLAAASIHRMAFPPALAPNWASQGSGRVSPDDLVMGDYCLGGHDDKMDERDGTQSPGPGRVSPNDLGRRDAKTDRHDSTQSSDGEFSVARVAT